MAAGAPASGLDAVILAGGAGQRAGAVDKGWMRHGDRALVEIAVERLRPQATTVWISANRNLARYAALGLPVLADGSPGSAGPLGGIARALTASRAAWLLSVPVDAPDFPADLVPRLLQQALDSELPCYAREDGREQPLFAIYPTTLAPRATAALASGERAVWRLLHGAGALPVPFEPGAFSNLNEPGLR